MANGKIQELDRHVLCCDWGTSSFRLWLVNYDSEEVMYEYKTDWGIKTIYDEWKQSDVPQRITFYTNYLKKAIDFIAVETNSELRRIPVIISGMASSSIGMQALPYAKLPFRMTGTGLVFKRMDSIEAFPHDLYLISGVCSDEDVMRGEETQIIGLSGHLVKKPCLCILPGTHSKHIHIEEEAITGFRTYMTGEMFQIISRYSVLQSSVKKAADHDEENWLYFESGVRKAADSSLLNALFMVRTNDILQEVESEKNYSFLSGLIIGSELISLMHFKLPIYLCGSQELSGLYERALFLLGFGNHVEVIAVEILDKAIVSGQLIFLKSCI